jgi:hypothetical protein
MKFRWGIFFFAFYLYRCGLSIYAQAMISNLGDTSTYHTGGRGTTPGFVEMISASRPLEATGLRAFGTAITETVGVVLSQLTGGNPYLINIGFQTIAFVGLFRLLKSVEPKVRKPLSLLLLLPTFNIWTSIASKEALVTFLFCMLLVVFSRMEKEGGRRYFLPSFLIVLLLVLKPHYAAAAVFLFSVASVCQRVKQRATVAFSLGLASLIPLFFLADRLDGFSQTVAGHFRTGAGTLTRAPYFSEPYDLFMKAPYGMFQSFFGPTVSEATVGALQMATFVEAVILVTVLLYLILRRLLDLGAYEVIVSGFTLFWILFPSYPFGIMNPGSAVRYRSGYLVFLLGVIVILMLGSLYRKDRNGRLERRDSTRTA